MVNKKKYFVVRTLMNSLNNMLIFFKLFLSFLIVQLTVSYARPHASASRK